MPTEMPKIRFRSIASGIFIDGVRVGHISTESS
jgi:hypothetical protein